MSVLTLAPETYNYIREGLIKSAYRTQVDIFYNYAVHTYFKNKDIEKEAKRLVTSWANLNMKSYCLKYKDEDFVNLSQFFSSYPNKEGLKTVQLLKYLECLQYNIEPEHWTLTEQENNDYEFLKKVVTGYKDAIIHSLEDYKTAKWAA